MIIIFIQEKGNTVVDVLSRKSVGRVIERVSKVAIGSRNKTCKYWRDNRNLEREF